MEITEQVDVSKPIKMADIAQDYVEIANLLERYCWTVDEKKWDMWIRCFTDDAVLELEGYRVQGHDGILDCIREHVGEYRVMRHLLSHPSIEIVDRESARARSYWELKSVTSRGNDVQGMGVYIDRILKTDGVWKFQRRTVRFDFLSRRGTPWGKGAPQLVGQPDD